LNARLGNWPGFQKIGRRKWVCLSGLNLSLYFREHGRRLSVKLSRWQRLSRILIFKLSIITVGQGSNMLWEFGAL
jgi:hypothetical protein